MKYSYTLYGTIKNPYLPEAWLGTFANLDLALDHARNPRSDETPKFIEVTTDFGTKYIKTIPFKG